MEKLEETTIDKLEEAIDHIITSPFICYEIMDQRLDFISKNIPRYYGSKYDKYDLNLISRLRYIKNHVATIRIVYGDHVFNNDKNRRIIIDEIITVINQRDNNMKTKKEYISLLKTSHQVDIESLAANAEIVSEEEYRIFLDAEKEWKMLGKPKAPILGLGLWIGIEEPKLFQLRTEIDISIPSEELLMEWAFMNKNINDYKSCTSACQNLFNKCDIKENNISYVIVEGNTLCTLALIETLKTNSVTCYIPAPHVNNMNSNSYLASDIFTLVD